MEATRAGGVDILRDYVRFPLYVYSRPFKGFYDMKHLGRGRTHFAVAMLVLLCIVTLAEVNYTGFLVSGVYDPEVNAPYVLVMTLAPVLLFITGNWCVTSIADGKGTVKQIVQVYAYALYPKIILTVLGILVSNAVTKEEAAFVTFLFVAGSVLFYFYLFVGLVIIHEYTFFRSLFMVLKTVFAMLVIVFVLALFASLLNELFTFIETIVYELRMRS